MGIREAHDRIEVLFKDEERKYEKYKGFIMHARTNDDIFINSEEMHEAFLKEIGLKLALNILEDECPELKETE